MTAQPPSARQPILWDMETGDPDDALTLILLLGHPRVELRAVTITPGTPEQVGMVHHIVRERFGRDDVRLGAFDLDHPKRCLSGWHERAFGARPQSRQAEHGPTLLWELCDEQTTLITGAPLKNLGEAIAHGERVGRPLRLGRLVAQGGFAGDDLVPEADRLPKFQGMQTCPTYNLNGAPKAALAALACPGIGSRWFVSKNVCHGVVYDQGLHQALAHSAARRPDLALIHELAQRTGLIDPPGKKLHDPLAACCALTPQIGRWAPVQLYRSGGAWGARRDEGSDTFIITGYDHDLFVRTLTE